MALVGGEEFCSYVALVSSATRPGSPARVVRRFPRVDRPGLPFPNAVAEFVLAGAAARRPDAGPTLSSHTLVLTVEDGSRIYVACCTFSAPADGRAEPRGICLLSRHPLLQQQLAAARAVHAALRRGARAAARAVRALLQLPMPVPGLELRVELGGALLRIPAAAEGAPASLGVPLVRLFDAVGIEKAVRLVELLVGEGRLALTSSDVGALGLCAQALLSLLLPFEWPHTLIPLLPERMPPGARSRPSRLCAECPRRARLRCRRQQAVREVGWVVGRRRLHE